MIVLASIPRSGSTYLFRCLAGLPQGSNTPPGSQERHGIVKTHRTPEHEPRLEGFDHDAGDRAIFLWGDIAEAVESTRRMRMNEQHFHNCADGHPRESFPPPTDIRDADTFGYEAIWDGWRDAPFPVLWARYETLRYPLTRAAIESWVGRPVGWLPWRNRATTLSDAERARISRAYGSLIDKTAHERAVHVG